MDTDKLYLVGKTKKRSKLKKKSNLIKIFSAHSEDGLEVGVGQVAFEVVRVDITGQTVVGCLQQVDGIDVGGRGRKRASELRVGHVGQGSVQFRS